MERDVFRELVIITIQVLAGVALVFGYIALCAFVSMWFISILAVVLFVVAIGPDLVDIAESRAYQKREVARGKTS